MFQAHVLKDSSVFTYPGRNIESDLLTAVLFPYADSILSIGSGPLEPYILAMHPYIRGKNVKITSVDYNEGVNEIVHRLKDGKKVSWTEIGKICKNPDRPNRDIEGERLKKHLEKLRQYEIDLSDDGFEVPEDVLEKVEFINEDIAEYLKRDTERFPIIVANFVLVNMERSGYNLAEIFNGIKNRLYEDGILSVNTTVLHAYGIQEDMSVDSKKAFLTILQQHEFGVFSNIVFELAITSANKFLGSTNILSQKTDGKIQIPDWFRKGISEELKEVFYENVQETIVRSVSEIIRPDNLNLVYLKNGYAVNIPILTVINTLQNMSGEKIIRLQFFSRLYQEYKASR